MTCPNSPPNWTSCRQPSPSAPAAQLDRPFPHAEALATARARALQLAQQLTAAADNHTPTPAANTTQDRWQATAQHIYPQLTQSPSWTPLQAALDRAAAAGVDAEQLLTRLAAEQPPTGADPAGDLLWRLYDQCDAAAPTTDDIPVEPAAEITGRPAEEPPHAQPAPAAGISR